MTPLKTAEKNPHCQWYTLHVTAGSEQKLSQEIIEKLKRHQKKDALADIFIPYNEAENAEKVKRNRQKSTHMPGYLFLHLDYTPEVGHLILSCRPKGLRFLNCDVLGTPRPLAVEEVEKLKKTIAAINEQNVKKVTFEVGEKVRIKEGPFASLEGDVEGVDYELEKIKISISLFGQRHAFLELDFSGVERLS